MATKDPEKIKAKKQRELERRKWLRANDADWRDAQNARDRTRRASDPKWRDMINARARRRDKERASADPTLRQRWNERQRRYRSEVTLWCKLRCSSLRRKSERLGLPFDLTPADIPVPALCPVLGLELRLDGDMNSPNRPTVDRLLPESGYVRGNVRVISHRANTLKRDCIDPKELRAVADYIERELEGATASAEDMFKQVGGQDADNGR